MGSQDSLHKKYWGLFAEIQKSEDVLFEESQPYRGLSAIISDKYMDVVGDFKDYLELANRQQGPIMEIGCGSGNCLLELAKRGWNVTGIDNSGDMLDLLRKRLQLLPADIQKRVTLIEADACDFQIVQKFSLIIMPNYTLPLFHRYEQQILVIKNAVQHLDVDGIFAFTYPELIPDKTDRIDGKISDIEFSHEQCVINGKVGVSFCNRNDNYYLLSNAYYKAVYPNGACKHFLESKQMTVFNYQKLEGMLKDAGLDVVQIKRDDNSLGQKMVVITASNLGNDYPLWHPYQMANSKASDRLVLVEGKGCRVTDQHGNSYIDVSGGLWSVQCGLGEPRIIEAITKQLIRLSYGTLFANRANEPALVLARKLISISPSPLPWVYLTNSGSESVELSIKLARLYYSLKGNHKKKEIVFLDQSYHGTYFGSMSVSGLFFEKNKFHPTLPGVSSISSPDIENCPAGMQKNDFIMMCAEELEQRIVDTRDSVAAFIAEPVLGSAGVLIPQREYFDRTQAICRAHDVLFIVDEVATGFGRTGYMFACEHFNLHPDILLLAKGINSGYLPLGAVLFSDAIGQTLLHNNISIGHGSSHNGNPACCSAGIAAINIIESDDLVEKAATSGKYFKDCMEGLKKYPIVKEVRGLGLMLAIKLQQMNGDSANPIQVKFLCKKLQQSGLLCYPGPSALSFLPPLIISKYEIDCVMNILHHVFNKMNS